MAGSQNLVAIFKAITARAWFGLLVGVVLASLTKIVTADVATQLDWDIVTWPAGSLSQSYTIGSGDVAVAFNQAGDSPPGDTTAFISSTPAIDQTSTGGLPSQEDTLFIRIDYGVGSINQVPIVVDFTHPGGVSNVSFTMFDLDADSWVDEVEVTATDGTNTFNPSSVVDSTSNDNVFDGTNTVTGINNTSQTTDDGNATFNFNQPGITQVTILYRNAVTVSNPAIQRIYLHDINFTYPEADLSISKSHVGNFKEGEIGTYTLNVSNNATASTEVGPITVTDTLPTGLAFNSASGIGWSCGAIGQNVTCTHPGPLAAGSSLPNISLDVTASVAAVPSVTNTAVVVGTSPDSNNVNNSSSDLTIVDPIQADLAIIKSHLGVFNEGALGTYTLSVTNDASADNEPGPISVTDTLPAGLTFNSATGVGWTCGAVAQVVTCAHAGPLAAGNSLPDITLDVLPGAVAVPSVTNTANVSGTLPDADNTNNSSSDFTIVIGAPTITPGNKPLYFYSAPANNLARAPPIAAQPNVRIRKNVNPSVTWTIVPVTQAPLIIDGNVGTIPVVLLLRKGGTSSSFVNRTIQVTLTTSLGVTGSFTQTVALNGTPTVHTFPIPIAADINLPAGSTISATVTNVTPVTGNAAFRVFPVSGGNNSRVELTAETVINVDSIQFFDAPFPGGSAVTSFAPGATAYVRAVVSDPFGSFDISGATITILDAASAPVVTNASMTQVADSGVDTRTYEFAQIVGTPFGSWTAVVTANEGTEGLVSDVDFNIFNVGGTPDVLLLKQSQVIDDGLGNSAPVAKAIPGATVMYTLNATNQGNGATDNNVSIEDPIPANTSLCVANPCAQGSPAIQFVDAPPGTISSGLGVPVISYSNSAGPVYTYGYIPVPDAAGFDSAVTSVRIQPSGQFNPASGGTPAGFSILFRVQVQ